MPSVSTSFILPYIQSNVRHSQYTVTCDKAHEINVHASGLYPENLIGERRPGEGDEIKAYRKKIFVAKTKPTFNKIYNSLMKIPRSPDMTIMFDEDSSSTIPEDESLKNYIDTGIPTWGSLTAWYWGICFRYYLIDANAVVLTMPYNFEAPDNEYLRPVPVVFTSDNIIDYTDKNSSFMVLLFIVKLFFQCIRNHRISNAIELMPAFIASSVYK